MLFGLKRWFCFIPWFKIPHPPLLFLKIYNELQSFVNMFNEKHVTGNNNWKSCLGVLISGNCGCGGVGWGRGWSVSFGLGASPAPHVAECGTVLSARLFFTAIMIIQHYDILTWHAFPNCNGLHKGSVICCYYLLSLRNHKYNITLLVRPVVFPLKVGHLLLILWWLNVF